MLSIQTVAHIGLRKRVALSPTLVFIKHLKSIKRVSLQESWERQQKKGKMEQGRGSVGVRKRKGSKREATEEKEQVRGKEGAKERKWR